ncbi:hypothetical protein E3J79_00430 [Candidatus Dependentiae bacterium]|nr:MAG: hypothetical protein E3J79_00430 [Candidatus Dependentiae bacterium]
MQKIVPLALVAGSSLCLLVNWTAQETTIAGNKKQPVNFYGTLETQEGNKYEVENISIGMLYKQIPLYEAPKEMEENHTLKTDPRRGIISRIDLSEASEIQVPHPHIVWNYQKKGSRKSKYIEIIVISNDKQKTKCSYLIDLRRKIFCDKVNKAGPIELEVPFQSLKHLVIKGYRHKEPEKKEKSPQA